MDPQILDHVMEVLKPLGVAGGKLMAESAVKSLWDWIKEKFKSRSAGAQEAVTGVEHAPQSESNWQVLRAQLAKALDEDPAFREELKQRLLKDFPSQTKQVANVTGDNNTTVQTAGSGNTVNIQK